MKEQNSFGVVNKTRVSSEKAMKHKINQTHFTNLKL